MENKGLNPVERGFIMPAEWEKHTATWACWPFNESMWFHQLDRVRAEYCTLIKTISQFEKVHLLVNDADVYQNAKQHLGFSEQIEFHEVPLNDIWFRDNGPIFIKNKTNNNVELVKWEFNSWGQKFNWDLDNLAANEVAKVLSMESIKTNIVMEGGSLDVNGAGVALTTKQCLLSQKRNPNLSKSEIEKSLHKYLGIKQCLWLENGLEGDHTDGHIDTIVRFVNENTIVCSLTEDKNDVNHNTMHHNYKLLKSYKINLYYDK